MGENHDAAEIGSERFRVTLRGRFVAGLAKHIPVTSNAAWEHVIELAATAEHVVADEVTPRLLVDEQLGPVEVAGLLDEGLANHGVCELDDPTLIAELVNALYRHAGVDGDVIEVVPVDEEEPT